MSRRHQLVIQLILWIAIGTFLFGIWAIMVGLRKPTATKPSIKGGITNGQAATQSTN